MKVSEAVASRRSCRAFLDTPVPGDTLRAILDAARRTPSGGNLQSWWVYALAGEPLAGLKTAVDTSVAGSWSVEMKIPFASLGVNRPAKRSTWRINFYRIDINPGGASRYLAWSPTKNWFHEPHVFGTLVFGR